MQTSSPACLIKEVLCPARTISHMAREILALNEF
jgi:hypothetical protein